MRCTDRSGRKRRARLRRRRRRIITCMSFILVILLAVAGYLFLHLEPEPAYLVRDYELEHYNQSYFRGDLFATDLCVTDENVPDASGQDPVHTDSLSSAALFDVEGANVAYAYHVFQKVYPASTTKIMTALVALESADLSDVVTVGVHADAKQSFSYDEATIGLSEGDTLSMEDLLYGLLLYSGNDAAVAIAEYVAGDTDSFAQMMNDKAWELMATQTHFVNANGLHDEDHYTTAYDLYLIFNACIQNEEFVRILSTDTYTAHVTGADGTTRTLKFEPSNLYATGDVDQPEGATVVGGKTGTTKNAGNCLILLDQDGEGNPYISVIMGADTKALLYEDMTSLVNEIAG